MTISKELTRNRLFLILDHGAQVLYFRLAVAARETGSLSPEEYQLALKPIRWLYTMEENLQELLENGYIRRCDTGAVQIAYDEAQRSELRELYRQQKKEQNAQE